jgi:hypothetical protein
MRLTMKGKNGSLNQFTQKVKNKHGDIVLSNTRTLKNLYYNSLIIVHVFYNEF